jgi:4-aminobutyrate aminotransferase-like enzyme
VSCAAGLAVLEVIQAEGLQQNALEVGRYLMDGLRRLALEHESIGDVRGAGLFVGADFVRERETRIPAPEIAMRMVNDLRRKNILISASGLDGNVLKIRPPLPFSRADADIFLAAMRDVLEESAGS